MSEIHGAASDRPRRLRKVIGYSAHLLPAQGPIASFVHHNTLHAYEYLPFEAAVVEAAGLFQSEPFLAEAEYREALAAGRIQDDDLRAVVTEDLGRHGDEPIAGLMTRRELWLRLLHRGTRDLRGPALEWLLREGGALDGAGDEHGLWEAARRVTGAGNAPPPSRARPPVRHRDLLLAATGADSDALVHPVLIRVCAAFLDQGVAYWPMPDRDLGMYRAFRRLYRHPRWCLEPWMRPLAALLDEQERCDASAVDVVLEVLDDLGVEEREWEPFLAASLLALSGWAGMVRQIEVRPDRVPVWAPPARLEDFLAVRFLLERSALEHLARAGGRDDAALASLRAEIARALGPEPERTAVERAWALFETARTAGWDEGRVSALAAADVAALLREYERCDEGQRRRLLHLAYERRHRVAILDALLAHAPQSPGDAAAAPCFQTVHCIDEREESLRRHLEEVEPRCETFGAAGYFGVAMYYRGACDAHATALCPIAIRPLHEVEEAVPEDGHEDHRRRRARRRWLGRAVYEARLASRTFARGALLSFGLGLAAAVPLTSRVLAPRWTARVRRAADRLWQMPQRTRLLLERGDRPVTLGCHAGFTVDEMTAIVAALLVDTGLAGRCARLVAIVGHGSSSLNNPHESAHDCGACGGGRGGPNARAFARMANDPRVRERLRDRGLVVPEATVFVALYHNSCDDAVTLLDAEDVPASHAEDVARLCAAVERARARTAHERCRRFDSASLRLSPRAALTHVEARCEDLAQPRPEYGHATNAACIVGRRALTRGLFLDRRAFLVSYDPGADDGAGTTLARVLAAVLPVAAGINLEYYFSRVDPVAYGCGTKLPHNLTALLGVMDGAASDLRTGLPWQMVEIHEPVRLLVVVEARPELLRGIVARNHDLARLLQNRWIQLAAWDPAHGDLFVFGRRGPVRHAPESSELARVGQSVEWYGGRRGFVPCATIATEGGAESRPPPC